MRKMVLGVLMMVVLLLGACNRKQETPYKNLTESERFKRNFLMRCEHDMKRKGDKPLDVLCECVADSLIANYPAWQLKELKKSDISYYSEKCVKALTSY